MDDFDELKCRYIIKGTLTNLSQLHIGAGTADTEFSMIDGPVIRLRVGSDELPYIPGSTLKGIFRTEVERYFRAIGEKVCYPYDHESVCNKAGDDGSLGDLCPVCEIFGSQKIASHIIISDAVLNKDAQVFLKVKPGVAINRITGATQRGAFYTFETVQPGAVFDFEMQIINIDMREDGKKQRAIKFVLRQLRDGWLQVGGKRSTGLGYIKIREVDGEPDARVIEIRPEYLETFKFPELKFNEFIGE